MTSNVVVITLPHMGSSLLVKIFNAHGLFVGEHAPRPEGYPSYENTEVMAELKGDARSIEAVVTQHLQEPWVIKAKPHWIGKLKPLSPTFVQTKRRGKEALVIDCPAVDMDEVLLGDYKSLETAFTHCGLTLDPDKAHACIDTNLWTWASK